MWEKDKENAAGLVTTDYWKSYNELAPEKQSVQTKAGTFTIESYSGQIRHFLARFGRTTNGFKTLFGTTVFGYLFDCRMKLAGQYLLDTDKTIQEIAGLAGYEHQPHFSTALKRS